MVVVVAVICAIPMWFIVATYVIPPLSLYILFVQRLIYAFKDSIVEIKQTVSKLLFALGWIQFGVTYLIRFPLVAL